MTQPARPNPFLLPSETGLRFALLIVLTIGAALSMYSWIHQAAGLNDGYISELRRCLAITGSPDISPNSVGIGPPSPELRQSLDRGRAFAACMQPYAIYRAVSIIGMTAGLLTAAGAVLLITPHIIVRRGHLAAFARDDAPEAYDALDVLRVEAGVARVTYLWNPLDVTAAGRAFGHPGRHFIGLSGGLIGLFYADPAAFRAAALHELSHFRNADVGRTYFATALWHAFLAVTLAPYLISLAPELRSASGPAFVLSSLWRVLGLTFLVYASRNGILREREFFADARAASYPDAAEGLRRMVGGLSPERAGVLKRLFLTHPDAGRRARALLDGADLFDVSDWGVFLSGAAAGIAFGGWAFVLSDLGTANIWTVTYLIGLLSAGVAVAVALLMIWRAVFGAVYGALPWPSAARIGWTLAFGLTAGNILSFQQVLNSDASAGRVLLDTALLFVVCGLLMTGIAYWTRRGAESWLRAARSRAGLRTNTLLAMAGMLLTALSCLVPVIAILNLGWMGLLPLVFLPVYPDFFASLGMLPAQLSALLSFLAITALSLTPLAGQWMNARQSVAANAGWACLGEPPPMQSPEAGAPGPNRSLQIGLIGGLLLSAMPVAVRIATALGTPAAAQDTDDFRLMLVTRVTWAIALAQPLVAVWAARRAGVLRASHGLFAAFVAALVMTIVAMIHHLLRGNEFNLIFLWYVLWQAVNRGALLSLPFALLAARRPRATVDGGPGAPAAGNAR